MRTFALVSVVLLFCLVAGASPAKREHAYDRLPGPVRERFVAAWQERLDVERRTVLTMRAYLRRQTSPTVRRESSAKLARQVDRVQALETNDPPYVPPLGDTWRVGDYGAYPYLVRVVAVIDAETFLGEFGREQRGGKGLQFVQMSTVGLAAGDDVDFRVADPLLVAGQREWFTGTRFVVQPMSLDRFADLVSNGH